MIITIFIATGIVVGLVAGLLGIGGGIIVVPALNYLLPHLGVANDVLMHVAVGTSLAIIVFTALSSSLSHQRKGGILWPVVKKILPMILVGTVAGSALAPYIPSHYLRMVFGVFAILMAIKLALSSPQSGNKPFQRHWSMWVVCFFIGLMCSLLGLGGGAIIVPYLSRYDFAMKNVVATAAVCGLPIALFASVGYILTGFSVADLPSWHLGYVYLPAVLGIAAGSVIFANIGARLAHKLPSVVLKRIFAVFLTAVAIDMLI